MVAASIQFHNYISTWDSSKSFYNLHFIYDLIFNPRFLISDVFEVLSALIHTSRRIQLFSQFYLRRIGFLRLLPQIGQICIIVFISNFCRNIGADSALYGNIPSIYRFGTPLRYKFTKWYVEGVSKNWVLPKKPFADLSWMSSVLLPNWKQDLQMLNCIKLIFLDTLFLCKMIKFPKIDFFISFKLPQSMQKDPKRNKISLKWLIIAKVDVFL